MRGNGWIRERLTSVSWFDKNEIWSFDKSFQQAAKNCVEYRLMCGMLMYSVDVFMIVMIKLFVDKIMLM